MQRFSPSVRRAPQVYTRVQAKLGKGARMSFQKLDKIVLDIVSVKTLKSFDEL